MSFVFIKVVIYTLFHVNFGHKWTTSNQTQMLFSLNVEWLVISVLLNPVLDRLLLFFLCQLAVIFLVQSSFRANFCDGLFFLRSVADLFVLSLSLYLRFTMWNEVSWVVCCVYLFLLFFYLATTEHQLNIHTKRSHIEYCATLKLKIICNGIHKKHTELEQTLYTFDRFHVYIEREI